MSKANAKSLPILTYTPSSASAVPIEVQGLTQHSHVRGMQPHAHLFFELVLVQSGRGRHVVDGIEHPAEPGMVFVLPPGSVHDMRGLADANGWSILFEADGVDAGMSLAQASSDELPRGFMFDLFRQPVLQLTQPIQLRAGALRSFAARVEQLRDELAWRHPGYEHAARANLHLLLVALARQAPWLQQAADAARPQPNLVTRAFADIDRHFRDASALAQAASRLGLSKGHLTTRLRQLTGRTYGEWVIERRMIESRRLLSATDLTLGQIAQALGYAEVESFIRRFRARHGSTPASWRGAARASLLPAP